MHETDTDFAEEAVPARFASELGVNPFLRVVTEKTDWIVGAAIAAFFAVVHAATSIFWVFPGDSARLVAYILRIEPLPVPRDQLFIWLFRLFAAFGGTAHATAAAAVGTLVVSSACLLFVYLLSVAVFRTMTDLPHLRDHVVGGERWVWLAPRAAGLLATVALGFSAPFWTASTRVNSDSFQLLWLLVSAYLVVRFMATDRLLPLYSAAAIYGVLCTQSPTAIQFFPILFSIAAIGAMRGERGLALTMAVPAAIVAVAAAVAALACTFAFAQGEGYRILRYYGPGAVFGNLVFGNLASALSGLSRPHWLVIGCTTVLPFVAWLAAGKWALDGTRFGAMRLLDLAILLASLLVLACSRYSPWGLFGFRAEQVTAYAMASMSFAYCVLAAHQQLLFLLNRKGQPPFPGARVFGLVLRVAVAAAAVAFLRFEARVGLVAADARPAKFLFTYVDALIDGLEGRDLLVTDSVLEDIVRIRAKERGLLLSVVNLAASPNSAGRRRLRERIEDPVLRNAFDLGIFPFLQEYIGHDPDAGRRVALTFFPDLWNIGPYRPYPHGLCFVGAPDDAPSDNPLSMPGDDPGSREVESWRAVAAKLGPELAAVPENAADAMLAASRVVRQRVSFIGNNLAYWLYVTDRTDEAIALWREVREFDPDNLSATLNLFTVYGSLGREKELEEIREELEEFRRKMTKPFQIWELSRSQGYVASPDAFASLGLSWALTGQTPLALGTLDAAIRDGIRDRTSRGASPILIAMGAIHGKMGDADAAERAFEKALAEDPGNVAALTGLVKAKLSKGDTAGVDELFDRLADSGAPPSSLVHVRANYLIQKGDPEAALETVRKGLEENPRDPDLMLDLFTASTAQLSSSTNPAVRIDARKRMEDTVQRLRADPAARTFQGAIASAALHLVDHEYSEAREEFRIADKSNPGVPAILHQILRLDYGLQDRLHAESHAREILNLVPRHGFANYIMGSLALGSGNLDSARAFLERSAQNWDSALPRGDLAYALYRLRENDKAELSARDAISRSANIYEIWDTLGLVLLASGRPEEARNAFEEALSRRSGARIVHLHLARAELMLGNVAAARGIMDELQNDEAKFHDEDLDFYNALWSDLHGGEKPPEPANRKR